MPISAFLIYTHMVLVFYFQYSKEQMLNILGKTFIIFILLFKIYILKI